MSERPIRLLFLDDSPAALSTVVGALASSSYVVHTATTLGEALAWVSFSDLVVVDFHMPGIDGAEALRHLRKSVGPDGGPVFYLYTTDTGVAGAFRRHGFDGAFTEKGNAQTLIAQLATVVRLLKMRRYMEARRDA